MNIQVQICGLVLMGLLVYFYRRQKTVGLYTERIFLRSLLFTIFSVGLDVLSVIAITHMEEIPAWMLELICRAYIVSILWVLYFGLAYVLANLFNEKERTKKLKYFLIIVCCVTVIDCFLPIFYYYDGSAVYSYGASISLIYAFTLAFMIVIMYYAIRYRKKLNAKRRSAVVIWMIPWVFAAILQFMDNSLLLVGFASALGMMILFFTLENPDANMDKQMGCFNANVLLEYVKQELNKKSDFCIMLISLEQYQKQSELKRINAFIRDLVNYLDGIPEIKVFKNVEAELVILFKDKELMDCVMNDVQERFLLKKSTIAKAKNEMPYYPLFVYIEDLKNVHSAEELLRLFQYFKQKATISEGMVFSVDDAAITEGQEREIMEKTIIEALDNDRIEVFFQPIYSTKAGQFVSAEALVRIRNVDGSIIPPGKFIPIAEGTGLISRIGIRVFEKICQFIQKQNPRQYGLEYIEVNLSVIQCHQESLANTYIGIMDMYKIDPSMINLEITETASIQTRKVLLKNMMALMDYGVSFSLDDFGNGQSNLDYLIDMPVSILKLDMNMTRAYFDNKKAKHAVKATVNLAHDMQLKVVAEGVETKEQLMGMAKIGVDYIQGYYFSKPLPASDFIKLINEKRNEED